VRSLPVLAALAAAALAPENLIHNGDARTASGWDRSGPQVYFAHDDEVGSTDKGSLRITVPADAQVQPYNWYQRVELSKRAPKRLEVSASIRLENLSSGGAANVMVQIYGEAPEALGYAWASELRANTDWRTVRGVFDVPEGARYIRVLAYLSGRGTVWFDDLALVETDAPVTPPPGGRAAVDDDMDALARGCASDLPWLFDGDLARKQARSSNRPVLVYVRCTDDKDHLDEARSTLEAKSIAIREDGYAKDLMFRAGPLSCPEIADLVARRTIPLCVTYNLGLSAGNPEKLGGFDALSSEVTTPALLVADERGKVLHRLDRIGTLSDDFVDHWLRTALEASSPKSKATDAESAYRDGDLDKVLALTGKSTADAQVLRAKALVRLGRLDDARKALGSLASGEALAVRGRIALRAGDTGEAARQLANALKKLEGDAAAEARFWSAWCDALSGRQDQAREAWRELAGPTRLGRRAAACALAWGPKLYVAANQRLWPRTKELPETTEGDPKPALDVARSVGALLELQREDGSFGESAGPQLGSYIDPAITAIVSDALAHVEGGLPAELRKRAAAVRERAERFLVDYAAAEQPGYRAMDPFNTAYAMASLARLRDKRSCARLVERIARLQLPDGNWTVYVPDRPASFNTALCCMALKLAADLGVDLPKDVLPRGLDALAAMRQSNDLFPYSTKTGHEWMTTDWGGIAREPLCEHVLLACGRGSKDTLGKALERFVEYHAQLRVPTKRLYDYFNDKGHGGYYFFFAHRNALEAARAFGSKQAIKKVTAAVHDAVLAAQEGDGTWMDKFLLGRAYGTAMALLVLVD